MASGAGGDRGLLPLVASRLQRFRTDKRNPVGPARLVCRQWAAEFPQGCSGLRVKGKGPDAWEHRFCGLQELTWLHPAENSGQSWPMLRSLRLERCSDEALLVLKKLPCLTSLDLFHCSITDEGLNKLSNLSTLTSLNLTRCYNITDAGLKSLEHMTSLTSLNLGICYNITDAGLKELRHMSALASLDLSGCSITDAGLKELEHMTSLTSLILDACYNITDVGLK